MTGLVGRDSEIQTISKHLPPRSGIGGIVISGPVGIGKTAVLDAVQSAAQGATVIRHHGVIGGRAWPYALEETSGAADHEGIELIPYFSWANRGPSTMRVWLTVQQQ